MKFDNLLKQHDERFFGEKQIISGIEIYPYYEIKLNIIKDKIGIFDSGIGGSTVLKEIIKLLPNEKYVYYSDSKNNPYGDKSQKEILAICDNIMKVLLDKGCKAIVIACNTASAQASQFLREKYKNILMP